MTRQPTANYHYNSMCLW